MRRQAWGNGGGGGGGGRLLVVCVFAGQKQDSTRKHTPTAMQGKPSGKCPGAAEGAVEGNGMHLWWRGRGGRGESVCVPQSMMERKKMALSLAKRVGDEGGWGKGSGKGTMVT